MKNISLKSLVIPAAATVLTVVTIANAAINSVFPTISNTFATAGEIIKSADINKLAEGINNLDQRTWVEGTALMSAPNNSDFIVTDDGKVGIGTTTPSAKLHIEGATGLNLSHGGYKEKNITHDGHLLGFKISGDSIVQMERSLPGGGDLDVLQFITGANIVMTMDADRNVGVGTKTPSTKLHVVGTITETSDERLKENITPVANALEKITQLNGVSFDWIDEEKMDDNTHLGLITQNVETVFPELVFTEETEFGTKSVNYDGLMGPMVEAMKELSLTNVQLNAENQAQNAQIQALEARLESAGL